jgi:SAM-dependent methyltransferase
LLYLWLERKTDFFSAPYRLLHIAPEHCYLRPFERLFGEKYITADLESPLAKVKLDVQQMPFGDCEFDVVICNHILEHVDSDRKALEEIYRVMRHCGWGILLSPVDYGLESSYEDPTKTTPEERREAFGQPDHLRIFGRDYADRLRAIGFEVEEIKATDFLSAEEITHYGIATDRIHLVRKL